MASIIPKNAPFLYPSSESKEIASFNSTNTDKKISAIANDTLEKAVPNGTLSYLLPKIESHQLMQHV